MNPWIFITAAIAFEVVGTMSLKPALDHPAFYLMVAAGYIGAFGALFLALRAGMNLGVAYGVWSAFGVALTAVLSWLVYGEPLTVVMGIGVAVVIAGVLLVEMGSSNEAARHGQAHDDGQAHDETTLPTEGGA